ncbi:hypothetical protein [Prosthecobacter sp.]|uniref:hypothetical protein n=1 Tax=Prosthecobacter sp. TaxID=1965333 RepID=UPI003784B47C
MNRKILAFGLNFATLIFCALLSSCKSKSVALPGDPLAFPTQEQELAYLPTYSKNVLAGWPKGRSLDRYDASRVRLDEQIHAYHLGRLPSKDRREMHEAHTVYRLEQGGRWDTRLPATPMDSRGVVLGVIDPARKDVPDDTIIKQEREALAAKAVSLRKSMADLEQLRTQLMQKKSDFEKATKDAEDIKTELNLLLQDRNRLKAELEKAETSIEELKEAERLRIGSSSQGLFQKKK